MKIVQVILRPEIKLIDSEKEDFNIMGTSSGTVTTHILQETANNGSSLSLRSLKRDDCFSSLMSALATWTRVADAIESAVLKKIGREELGLEIRGWDQARVFYKIDALVVDIQLADQSLVRLVNPRGENE